MREDIKIQVNKEANIDESYKTSYGQSTKDWPLHVQAQYNTEKTNARNDRAAFTSQANNLIREYNSQSGKFNWAPFNTKGDKPPEKFEELR